MVLILIRCGNSFYIVSRHGRRLRHSTGTAGRRRYSTAPAGSFSLGFATRRWYNAKDNHADRGRRLLAQIGIGRRGRIGLLAACLCLSAPLLCGCARAEAVSRTGYFFGTVVEVTVYAGKETAEAALDAVMARFNEIEQELSVNIAGSDVTASTRRGRRLGIGRYMKVLLGLSISRIVEWAFDPTLDRW
jgi:hypothetical protein